MDQTHLTLRQFYADRVRQRSEELVFGKHWYDEARGQFQVCWVRDTGELAVIAAWSSSNFGILGDSGDTIVGMAAGVLADLATGAALGRIHSDQAPSEVEIVAVVHDESTIDSMLAGWKEQEQSGTGLVWLRSRAFTGT